MVVTPQKPLAKLANQSVWGLARTVDPRLFLNSLDQQAIPTAVISLQIDSVFPVRQQMMHNYQTMRLAAAHSPSANSAMKVQHVEMQSSEDYLLHKG